MCALGRHGFIWFKLKSHWLSVKAVHFLLLHIHQAQTSLILSIRTVPTNKEIRRSPKTPDLSVMKSPGWPLNICLFCICASVSLTSGADKHTHSLTPAIVGELETVVCICWKHKCFTWGIDVTNGGADCSVEMNPVWWAFSAAPYLRPCQNLKV